MGKRNKVTTRDIAEYTGVSQSTVSMILSNKPHVSFSKETIDKVRQGAKELGYKKPVAGVKKKEQALAKSIIVICPLLSNGYYSMIIHSITERAKDYGYTVFTVSTLRDVSQEELYLNLLSGFELAGVISLYPLIYSTSGDNIKLSSQRSLLPFTRKRILSPFLTSVTIGST